MKRKEERGEREEVEENWQNRRGEGLEVDDAWGNKYRAIRSWKQAAVGVAYEQRERLLITRR